MPSLRALVESIAFVRSRLAAVAGKTFGGDRDMYAALGYSRVLSITDFRERYRRNAVAARIIEAKPQDTWRGGFDLVEDPVAGKKDTAFEQAWDELNRRLKLTSLLQRADTLAGFGHYAVIVIGAPGNLETPLTRVNAEDIAFVRAFAEDDATIAEFDKDEKSPRFGLPTFYLLKRARTKGAQSVNLDVGKKVHWTRVRHIADGLLDDDIYGTPRLERVWNLLDDLEKVTGGGAEAFWNRANQGMQVDIDPDVEMDADDEAAMDEQVENYRHKLERVLKTRGTKINMLGSDVADIRGPAEAIMAQISAGCGIPQRVLTGSEQGKMAAEQDSVKYYRGIEARRVDFAENQVLRPFVDYLIELGALPKPAKPYSVSWSQIKTMDESERADIALKWSQLNAAWTDTGMVVTPDEIRELLDKEPMTDAERKKWEQKAQEKKQSAVVEEDDLVDDDEPRSDKEPRKPNFGRPRAAARRKESASWEIIHRAADRFPG